MDENLYSQTYSQIVSKALNGNPNFQMLAQPVNFSFPVAPAGQIAPAAYQFVSRMPVWAALGSFNAGDTATADAYRQVLSHVTFRLDPGQQNDYRRLKDQVTQAENAMTKAITDQNQAYLTQKQNGGAIFAAKFPDITTWLAGPGAAFDQDIANKTAVFKRTSQLLAELQQNAMPPSLQDAVNAMKLPDGTPGNGNTPRGWAIVPDGAGNLQWQPDWIIGTTGQDWRATLASGSAGAFSVTIDAADNTRDFSRSWAQGSGSADRFFWSVSVSGSWEKLDLTTNDQSVKATISAKSSTLVPVTPGAWYDGGFMRELSQSSGTGSGFSIAAGSPPLFGKNGLLPTMVSGLMVVYQPSVSISMSKATLEQHKEKLEVSGGLRIGPFTMGGSGGHESEFTHSTQDNGTYTAESTSEDPLIIGVTVGFPPNQDAAGVNRSLRTARKTTARTPRNRPAGTR